MMVYDIQGIELAVPFRKAFAFLADPTQWPKWTNAFVSVSGQTAVMRTPEGESSIRFDCNTSDRTGNIDITLHFPDGTSMTCYTRVVGNEDRSCYTFVLPAPPAALEELEGDLAQQSETLAEELQRAKAILENGNA